MMNYPIAKSGREILRNTPVDAVGSGVVTPSRHPCFVGCCQEINFLGASEVSLASPLVVNLRDSELHTPHPDLQ